jgi:hypothetical protein
VLNSSSQLVSRGIADPRLNPMAPVRNLPGCPDDAAPEPFVITKLDPGWITMLPSAELVMVTFVSVALPRAPPMARMPAPLLDLSIRTLLITTSGIVPPPVLN